MKHKIFIMVVFSLLIMGSISCSSFITSYTYTKVGIATMTAVITTTNSSGSSGVGFYINGDANWDSSKFGYHNNGNTYSILFEKDKDNLETRVKVVFTLDENNSTDKGDVYFFLDGGHFASQSFLKEKAKINATREDKYIYVTLYPEQELKCSQKNVTARLSGNITIGIEGAE